MEELGTDENAQWGSNTDTSAAINDGDGDNAHELTELAALKTSKRENVPEPEPLQDPEMMNVPLKPLIKKDGCENHLHQIKL